MPNRFWNFILRSILTLFHYYYLHNFRFTSLGILHVTKKKVPEVLTRRLLQQTTPRGQMVDQMEVVDVDMTTAQISAGKIHKRSMYMYD